MPTQQPTAYREWLSKFGGGYRYFDEHGGLPAGGIRADRHEPLYEHPLGMNLDVVRCIAHRLSGERALTDDQRRALAFQLRRAIGDP